MKIALAISLLSMCCVHAQFVDDFSDGDFVLNPTWVGDQSKFIISSNRLKLQAPAAAGKAYLSVPSQAVHEASWEFSVQFDFNPSSSNFSRIYLISDQADLGASLNGYLVKVGNTTREVSLYSQTGNTETELIDGLDDRLNLPIVNLRVRVLRSATGTWTLHTDVGHTGIFASEGEAMDVTHTQSSAFGVQCVYTSTRSDKFLFDDFVVVGTVVPPTEPPPIANYKDLILTELFSDPSPQVGLPAAEFVEVYNRGASPFDLKSWVFSDGVTVALVPAAVIQPGEYRVLTASSAVDQFHAGAIGLSNFPSLNNSGDILTIKDHRGVTIDSVSYSIDWYGDEDKAGGGWSLELIDPENPCGEEDNWMASEDARGGTPGQPNSVLASKPDLTPPKLVSVWPTLNTLFLQFNERLMTASIQASAIYIFPEIQITNAFATDATLRSVSVELSEAIHTRTTYSVRVHGIMDCNGNEIELDSLEFGLPEAADSSDVVINEILFNPRSGGVDFVELCNASPKFISLDRWSLAGETSATTIPGVLLAPFQIVALSEDLTTIELQYPSTAPRNLVESDVPGLPDDSGMLSLLNSDCLPMDQLVYESAWHSEFLKSDEGISLERIDIKGPTQARSNWISASSSVGFATPGYSNSQQRLALAVDEEVTVVPEIFSPGIPGMDFVQIQYRFSQPGRVANVTIVNHQGALVKTISNNDLLGTEGFLRWDGDRQDGDQAQAGYYVVWFETFHSDGSVSTFRKRVVVARR